MEREKLEERERERGRDEYRSPLQCILVGARKETLESRGRYRDLNKSLFEERMVGRGFS